MQCDMHSAEKLELQHQHLIHNVLERSLLNQWISYHKIILESIMVIQYWLRIDCATVYKQMQDFSI